MHETILEKSEKGRKRKELAEDRITSYIAEKLEQSVTKQKLDPAPVINRETDHGPGTSNMRANMSSNLVSTSHDTSNQSGVKRKSAGMEYDYYPM